jgi:penicillin-binding protein 1A
MAGPLGSSGSSGANPRARGASPIGRASAAGDFFSSGGHDAFWGRDGRTKRADKASSGRVPKHGKPTKGKGGKRGEARAATRRQGAAVPPRRRPPRAAGTVTGPPWAAPGPERTGLHATGQGDTSSFATRRGPGALPPGGAAGAPGGRGPGGRGPRGRGPGGGRGDAGDQDGPGKPARKRSVLWRWRRPLFLMALVMLALMAAVGAFFASTELPAVDALAQSSYICAEDVTEACNAQNAMAKLQGDEDRTNVRLDELPDELIHAVVAMEDRDFFKHKGVNPMSIGRALYRDIRGDAIQQGGSTITQQYVKNAFLSPERALTRKIKEAVLSIKLEQRMSKEEILEGYLNTIYFGRGAYGVAAASQVYFGKDVREIGLAEATYLAGLIRAPVLADASKHPEEAARRRKTALVAMEQEGYITAEHVELVDGVAFEEPYFRPLAKVKLIDTLKGADFGTPYVTMYVRDELKRLGFTEQQIDTGGLRVYTSLDYEMQQAAWEAVASTLTDPDDPEAALVAVDDQGLVRALVGSRHGYTPEEYENNYAVRGHGSNGRQTGSTFKVVALAETVRRDFSLDSRFDAPAEKEFPEAPDEEGNPWKVRNYDESERGTLNVYEATKESSNTAYAQLMLELGPQSVADLAERMGIGAGEELAPNPSLVLGTANATPLEMAGVYSTFANRGMYRKPDAVTRVEQVDQDGKATLLYQRQVTEERILPESKADLVNHTLQGVIEDGTGTAADIGKPAAGKTGTAQNNWDAWFAGYVPKLTAVVWMGHPEGSIPMENVQGRATVTGGSLPAEIWQKFMSVATGDSTDEFVEVSPEALEAGEVINDDLLTSAERATTTTTAAPEPPVTTETTRPGRPGGPARPTTTAPPPTETTVETTTTTAPSPTLPVTSTTEGGGGGGGQGGGGQGGGGG